MYNTTTQQFSQHTLNKMFRKICNNISKKNIFVHQRTCNSYKQITGLDTITIYKAFEASKSKITQ